MRRTSRCGTHLNAILSFSAHGEFFLPVNQPYHTVGNRAGLELEPYIHDNLGNHVVHMDVDADKEDFEIQLTLADCRNKIHCSHVRNSAHSLTAIVDQQMDGRLISNVLTTT